MSRERWGGIVRRLSASLLGLLLLPLLPGIAAAAGDPPPAALGESTNLDGAAIVRQLAQDPVAVLPGAPARFDEQQVRSELAAADRAVRGRVYLVVLPYSYDSEYDLQTAFDGRLGQDDQVIAVMGLDVTVPSWVDFAGGRYLDRQYQQLWTQVNTAHQRRVLENHDVTGPVTDLLRLLRGAPTTGARPTTIGPTDPALLEEITGTLRGQRMYVAPELGVAEDDRHRLDPYSYLDTVSYKLVYLPSDPVAGHSDDLLAALGERFPDRVILLVRGQWLQASGPGDASKLSRAVHAGINTQLDWLLGGGNYADAANDFLDRFEQLSNGSLDPRAVPVRPVDTGVLGTRLGVAAFVATALGLAALSLGGWWGVLRRRRSAEASRFRVAHAEAVTELARFVARVGTLNSTADHGIGHLQAQIGERYTTAVALLEQARTSKQLDTARDTVAEGMRLLAELPPSAAEQVRSALGERAQPASRRPRRKPADQQGSAQPGAGPGVLARLRGGVVQRRSRVLLLLAATLAAVVGFGGPLVLDSPLDDAPITAEASRAIDGLRAGSVYAEPGSVAKLDVARARAAIGDRTMLVAWFGDERRFHVEAPVYQDEITGYSEDPQAARGDGYHDLLLDTQVPLRMICQAIADAYPDSFVTVIHPSPNYAESCVGPGFPDEEYDTGQPWAVGTQASASVAARGAVARGDLTGYVGELVASYEDDQSQLETAPGERFLGGQYRMLYLIGFIGLAVAAATLLFLASRHGVGVLQRVRRSRRELAGTKALASAEVSRLAGLLTELERAAVGASPDEARSTTLVELSEEYLRIVIRMEAARGAEQFGVLAQQTGELADAAGRRLAGTAAGH